MAIIPSMDGNAVTLMIRFKNGAGTWMRRPAARGANGRVKPGHALIDDNIVSVKNWTYDLRYTVDRKTAYLPVDSLLEVKRFRWGGFGFSRHKGLSL